MFEQSYDTPAFDNHYKDHDALPIAPNNTVKQSGFNRVVAFGYGGHETHQLPISRVSRRISILGLGHQGTVSAICLAALGHKVIGVDQDQRRVNALNQGRTFSDEQGLCELLNQISRFNNLVATDDAYNAVKNTDVTLVCPKDEGEQSSQQLVAICQQIGALLKHKTSFHTLVFCHPISTSLLNEYVISVIEASSGKISGVDFGVCAVQKPMTKKQAIKDFYQPSQITINYTDKKSCLLCEQIFDGFKTSIRRVKW